MKYSLETELRSLVDDPAERAYFYELLKEFIKGPGQIKKESSIGIYSIKDIGRLWFTEDHKIRGHFGKRPESVVFDIDEDGFYLRYLDGNGIYECVCTFDEHAHTPIRAQLHYYDKNTVDYLDKEVFKKPENPKNSDEIQDFFKRLDCGSYYKKLQEYGILPDYSTPEQIVDLAGKKDANRVFYEVAGKELMNFENYPKIVKTAMENVEEYLTDVEKYLTDEERAQAAAAEKAWFNMLGETLNENKGPRR